MEAGESLKEAPVALRPTHATAGKRSCIRLTPPNRRQQRTIVVLGVERGGTSMVAGVIRALGINMGERAGLNHEDPRFNTDDEELLARRIQERNQTLAVWGFKMPKAAMHLDFYHRHLRNPHYIVVFRNIAAVMDSWDQRGAGQPGDVLERVIEYYSRIGRFVRESGAPAMVVNYERATAEGDAFVTDLAEFLDIELDAELTARATSIITGDGRGYVNLPEHYFVVQSKPALSGACTPGTEFACRDNLAEVAEPDGRVEYDSHAKKVVFTPVDGAPLPRSFWISFDLEASREDLEASSFRTYFDFTGAFFPGHATRPPLEAGRNVLHVETNGKARQMAFGPLRPRTRFAIRDVRFYAAEDDGTAGRESVPPPRSSLARRALRRLKERIGR